MLIIQNHIIASYNQDLKLSCLLAIKTIKKRTVYYVSSLLRCNRKFNRIYSGTTHYQLHPSPPATSQLPVLESPPVNPVPFTTDISLSSSSNFSDPSPSFSTITPVSEPLPNCQQYTRLDGTYWEPPTSTRRTNLAMNPNPIIPLQFKDINIIPEVEKQNWLSAIDSEIQSLATFSVINSPPPNANLVDGKWVFKIKYKTW